jgi:mannosyltransferase OCH1-like enzyme
MSTNTIPKRIFQTWKYKQISGELQAIVDGWKIHNPSYAYDLMDDDDCIQFIRQNFDETILKTFRRIVPGALKADFWRYCVLYIHGGVYADLDTLCLNALDQFIDGYEFVTVVDFNTNRQEGRHNLFNSFIACVPRHPIMLGCINRIVEYVRTNTIPFSRLDRTGPGVLGRETNLYLKRGETESFVKKEGVHDDGKLLLLHFNRAECVGFKHGASLFQNKNGNANLIHVYGSEYAKADICCWLNNDPWTKEETVEAVAVAEAAVVPLSPVQDAV